MLEVKKIRDLTMNKGDLGVAYVSAASGIAVAGKYAYVVADDQMCLACFDFDAGTPGDWIRLFSGDLPHDHMARKSKKPDLEAICVLPPNKYAAHGALLVVPSGSKEWRSKGCLLPIDTNGKIASELLPLSFSGLFRFLGTKVRKLNIEGVAVLGEKLLLANRGNSRDGDNAVIVLSLNDFLYQAYDTHEINSKAFLAAHHKELGKVNGVALSFTDLCVLPGDRIIYCAAAEATNDDYMDGACAGSAIAIGDGKFQDLRMQILNTRLKVEGVYARSVPGKPGVAELILVTDGDADASIGGMLSTFVTL